MPYITFPESVNFHQSFPKMKTKIWMIVEGPFLKKREESFRIIYWGLRNC